MKNTQLLKVVLLIGAGLSAVTAGRAQALTDITVERMEQHVQIGASTTVAAPAPYVFRVDVDGDDSTSSTDPITSATLSGVATGTLDYSVSSKAWRFQDYTRATLTDLTTAYPNGNYTVSAFVNEVPYGVGSVTVSLADPTSSHLAIPLMTLTGGSWVENRYVINNSATLTIDMNEPYTTNPAPTLLPLGTTPNLLGYHYDLGIYGNGGGETVAEGFLVCDPLKSESAPDKPPSFTALPGTLAPGNYNVELIYDAIQSSTETSLATTGVAVGLYGAQTVLNLTVIPEPSTWTLLAGLASLGFVWLRRFRVQSRSR
ncbi:MAG: PEP-CTERM sorting domain-containing protein [Opitutaceae bacterium]|nr:PEP-CTERM sorting domain-containing protein [Opitutaceae bacterium]